MIQGGKIRGLKIFLIGSEKNPCFRIPPPSLPPTHKLLSLYLEGTYEEHVYSQHIRYEMPPPHSSSTIIVANQSPAFLQPLRHSPYCPLEFWNISERASTALLNTNSAMEMAQYQIKVF